MITSLTAVVIESHAARTASLAARARHGSSVAREALAAVGRWVHTIDGAAAGDVWIADADAPRVLVVLAAAPGLPLAESLPWQVRAVLRVLGIPMLAAPPPGGAVRVLVGDAALPAPTAARVALEATGYRVTFAPRA